MRNVEYKVGKDGYYTTCRTLESAERQVKGDSKFAIQTVLRKAEKVASNRSYVRNAMIKQFGRVHPSLLEKVKI